MNKILVIGLMFSFGLPILYLIVAIFYWCGHWVDRYTFLRRVTPPPKTHDLQMGIVANSILPVAILLHSGLALKFLSDM